MQGAKDLIASERGFFCLAVLAAVTLLAALKVVTGADWMTMAKYLTISIVAAKTATTTVDQFLKRDAVPPPTASS